MAQANLMNATTTIDTSWDNIVIVDNFQSIRGGKTLDASAITATTILRAGHPIIEETSTGELKPLPVSGAAFAALPAGHTYAGVLINSQFTNRPMAGMMVRGTVNYLAFTAAATAGKEAYYTGYAGIVAAIKTANPLIDFRGDR